MKRFLVSVLLLLHGGLLFSQETRIELGDKYFDQFAFIKAIKLYEGAKDRHKNWEVYAKLGDCYNYLSRPKDASKNYEIAISKKKSIKATYLLKYALSLQSTGSSQDSIIKAFQKYYDRIGSTDGIIQTSSVDSSYAEPENLSSINSDKSDFGSYIFNDILYFASSRKNPDKKRRFNNRLYKWNEQPFLDIYSAAIYRNANDSLALLLAENSNIGLNTISHESTVAITNDSTKMYFSGGIVKNNKLDYNKRGTSDLKLQRASRDTISNKWVVTKDDEKAMGFFDFENYSIGNPALGPNNNRLFFITCAPFPDAKGQTDIYYVNINDVGPSGKVKPKSLPPGINTNGRESFPYISKDGTLYFSSDGIYNDILGLGMYDIYKVEKFDQLIQKLENYETGIAQAELANNTNEVERLSKERDSLKKETKVSSLGRPYNSVKDDFAYFREEPKDAKDEEVYAYFSSNRVAPNAKGDDDIYRVKEKIFKTIHGIVLDFSTQNPLANAFVDLIDSEGLKTVQVDSSGSFEFKVKVDQIYRLRGSMTRYDDDLVVYNSAENNDTINLVLKPYPCEIAIDHIEFDPDSAVISFQAKVALLPLLEILWTNPEIKIRIESHTDSHRSQEYNLDLSERRAQATKAYLIGADVKESQITSAQGFGEYCLLISDEEIKKLPTQKERLDAHEKNRRSRFILEDCGKDTEGCENEDLKG